MLSKIEAIKTAYALGFDEIGFTTAEPFESHKGVLVQRAEGYAFFLKNPVGLLDGTEPQKLMREARSIIVLVHYQLKESFPPFMEAHFGSFYIDEDRTFKKEMVGKVDEFASMLQENGIKAEVTSQLPKRACAARAGIGSVGKNCLMYSRRARFENSYMFISTILTDQSFDPDEPINEKEFGCPSFCKNACIASCPTRALKGPRHIDPRKCISYNFLAREITPRELRIPMGIWVYGCDRCQRVCPRNAPWLAREKPVNKRVEAKKPDFDLPKLLHMDEAYFRTKIWPHMYYISGSNLWLWQMNVARVMGNMLDRKYIPDLVQAFRENPDERVKGMAAWALGRIGGAASKSALENFLPDSQGMVRDEIQQALV